MRRSCLSFCSSVNLLIFKINERNILSPSSALKMETICLSETLVSTYEYTRSHKPEHHHPHSFFLSVAIYRRLPVKLMLQSVNLLVSIPTSRKYTSLTKPPIQLIRSIFIPRKKVQLRCEVLTAEARVRRFSFHNIISKYVKCNFNGSFQETINSSVTPAHDADTFP
jgi:hypothetical protein